MNRFAFSIALLVLGSISLSTSDAFSQYRDNRGSVPNRPTVSPYLNLLRRGGGIGLNYYGLVKPEQRLRDQARRQQQQTRELERNQRRIAEQQRQLLNPYSLPPGDRRTGGSALIRPTGHQTTTFNTMGYFGGR